MGHDFETPVLERDVDTYLFLSQVRDFNFTGERFASKISCKRGCLSSTGGSLSK